MKTAAIFFSCLSILWAGCGEKQHTLLQALDPGTTNIHFKNLLVEDESLNVSHYIYFYNGSGVAVGDINNDGLTDILFTGNMVKNRLYLNQGEFVFKDITPQSQVSSMQGWCTGATMVDINQDGWLDIYICRSADDNPEKRKNLLFINNGDLSFTEAADKFGLGDKGYSTQASFFDYDKDGDLDCFVLNHSLSKYASGTNANTALRNTRNPDFASRLYQNNNGYFVDVTEKSGMRFNVLSFGLGIAVSDFNNDGWPDMYISNDFVEPDYLYMNNGDGSFSEMFPNCFDACSLNSMGSDAADFNNDSFVDLITLDMLSEENYLQKTHTGHDNFDKTSLVIERGFQPQYVRNMLQKNNGDGTFSELGQLYGVSNTDWSWASLFVDLDNDGYKDLLITNGFVKDFSDLDFINFSSDQLVKANKGEPKSSFKEIVEKMPVIDLPNYVFRNRDGNAFDNRTKLWGFDKKVISTGAVYADLNNDGNMDIVVNNSNEVAGVYRNNGITDTAHFLKVTLKGNNKNREGIGAKVKLFCGGKQLYQEQFPVRGYQSTVDRVLNFGIGKAGMVDSLLVIWPNDQYQVLRDIQPGQLLVLEQKDATGLWNYNKSVPQTYFSRFDGLKANHRENDFNDFTIQPLLPHYFSRQGPCLAKADVNRDGLDDLFIGGAKGQPGQLFIQSRTGSFLLSAQKALVRDSLAEDVAAVFFDANGDGWPDLYVGSGGYEFSAADELLQDRLYINDGKGHFNRVNDALPVQTTSTGCVRVSDIDADGDLDLFVGGRVLPGRYPATPESFIWINDGNGKFVDATMKIAPPIKNIGMVTDAVWTDLNKDGQADLIIVGEWMPVKVFINKAGKLEDHSKKYIPFESTGWWNTIAADDFDNDGDVDFVIGNQGNNGQFKAAVKEPLSVYFKDFDGNGSIDPVFCYYIGGRPYPAPARDDLVEQLPMLKNKFLEYKKYATAMINDIFTPMQLKDVQVLTAAMTQTAYLQNNGEAGFELRELPQEVQYAPVYSTLAADVNGDGNKDLVMTGNNIWTRTKFGRYRANHGTVLLGNGKGEFSTVRQPLTGFNVRADVRSMQVLKDKAAGILVLGINDAAVEAYQFNHKN